MTTVEIASVTTTARQTVARFTGSAGSGQGQKVSVHWTRVQHIADNTKESKIYGTPRLQNIVPQIWDIRKVGGGSAEMFWQGAFPGISFETMPEMIKEGGVVELDEDSVKEQVQKYMNKLQRYIALTGIHANNMAPDVVSPESHLKAALDVLCAAIDVPVPIFLGQQEGHLASLANKEYWNGRIGERRSNYAIPKMIRPTIKRFADLGVVSKPAQVVVEWNDPNTQTDTEKADIFLKKSQAVSQFAGSNARFYIDNHTFLTEFAGMSDEKAAAVIERMKTIKDQVPEEIINPTPKMSPEQVELGKAKIDQDGKNAKLSAKTALKTKALGGNQTGKKASGAKKGRPAGKVSKS